MLSQVLPPERFYEWHLSGIRNEIVYLDTIFMADLGLNGDGVSLNDDIILIAFAKMSALPSVLVFPEGNFKFSKTIELVSNIKIMGAGAEKTKLIFDCNGSRNLISINGKIVKDTIKLKLDNKKGDMFLTMNNAKSLSSNDYILICDNDSEKITSDWAKNTIGQICCIDVVDGQSLMLKSALRRDYTNIDSTYIFKITPAGNVHIESLTIERLDSTAQQTSNISFNYSTDCKVKCIKSINCNFAHIDIRNSTNIEVEGSYFESAFNYGGGGKAYGVMIQSSSGECLVENNIFKHLRHSMILQSGANGNVFGYNYSIEPYWTDVMLPSNSSGDAVLHGNYPYSNLFEGNICQNIVIDNSHGINGPDNTFFRNRAELYGIFMNTNPASNHQNFIGNEITNSEVLKGLYVLSGIEHIEYGNNVKGQINPKGTEQLSELSYYLFQPPDWYKTNSNFPPIGTPNNLNQYDNEAKTRYLAGRLTSCDNLPTKIEDSESAMQFEIFPNPATNQVYLRLDDIFEKNIRLEIYNILGIKQTGYEFCSDEKMIKIDISSLPAGTYFLQLNFSEGVRTRKFVK
jgi:hypothetical protein